MLNVCSIVCLQEWLWFEAVEGALLPLVDQVNYSWYFNWDTAVGVVLCGVCVCARGVCVWRVACVCVYARCVRVCVCVCVCVFVYVGYAKPARPACHQQHPGPAYNAIECGVRTCGIQWQLMRGTQVA